MLCVVCYDLGCVFVFMLKGEVLCIGVLVGSCFGYVVVCNVLLLLYLCYILYCYFFQDDDVSFLLLFGGFFVDGWVDFIFEQICGLLFNLNEMGNYLVCDLQCKVVGIDLGQVLVKQFGVDVVCELECFVGVLGKVLEVYFQSDELVLFIFCFDDFLCKCILFFVVEMCGFVLFCNLDKGNCVLCYLMVELLLCLECLLFMDFGYDVIVVL